MVNDHLAKTRIECEEKLVVMIEEMKGEIAKAKKAAANSMK